MLGMLGNFVRNVRKKVKTWKIRSPKLRKKLLCCRNHAIIGFLGVIIQRSDAGVVMPGLARKKKL